MDLIYVLKYKKFLINLSLQEDRKLHLVALVCVSEYRNLRQPFAEEHQNVNFSGPNLCFATQKSPS